jgi:hypothetical protein
MSEAEGAALEVSGAVIFVSDEDGAVGGIEGLEGAGELSTVESVGTLSGALRASDRWARPEAMCFAESISLRSTHSFPITNHSSSVTRAGSLVRGDRATGFFFVEGSGGGTVSSFGSTSLFNVPSQNCRESWI